MIRLAGVLSQSLPPAALPDAVRASLGGPLRRAASLTQLAALGAATLLPPARRSARLHVYWQSASGPQAETRALLAALHTGNELMPYDFLATQPAITAAQLKPLLPGLALVSHLPQVVSPGSDTPVNDAGVDWPLMVTLALDALQSGEADDCLCAHLDNSADIPPGASSGDQSALLVGHWLWLSRTATPALARLQPGGDRSPLPATADLPARLGHQLAADATATLPVWGGLTVECIPIPQTNRHEP